MRVTLPSLCERCLDLLSAKVQRDVHACRVETLWCPHAAVLAMCVVEGVQVSHVTVQGPLTQEEAAAHVKELEAFESAQQAP